MRACLLSGLGLSLLIGCGPAGGLTGVGLADWAEETGFGHIGTSVVCLGADDVRAADVYRDGQDGWRVTGRVIEEGTDRRSPGNLDPCWGPPGRSVIVETAEGVRFEVGYRWQSHSLGDMTPEMPVAPGDEIEVVYRMGEAAGSAGFVVLAEDELIYAVESGRDSTALTEEDLPGFRVTRGEVMASGSASAEACAVLMSAEAAGARFLGEGSWAVWCETSSNLKEWCQSCKEARKEPGQGEGKSQASTNETSQQPIQG